MIQETNLWIGKANQDVKTVEILIQSKEGPSEIICFHCQQAAEKFLKGFLIDNNIEFPRTHDLLMLIEKYILPFDKTFHEIIPAATEITGYATAARYPDPDEAFNMNAALEAYQAMTEIKTFVLAKIKVD